MQSEFLDAKLARSKAVQDLDTLRAQVKAAQAAEQSHLEQHAADLQEAMARLERRRHGG